MRCTWASKSLKNTCVLSVDESPISTHVFFKDLLAHVKRIGGYRTASETDIT